VGHHLLGADVFLQFSRLYMPRDAAATTAPGGASQKAIASLMPSVV
jgi:hypothetical protein